VFHLTVAIARFFEFLLLDIVRSIAGLVAFALVLLVAGAAAIVALIRLGQRIARHRR
jgi:hypothetical protein